MNDNDGFFVLGFVFMILTLGGCMGSHFKEREIEYQIANVGAVALQDAAYQCILKQETK